MYNVLILSAGRRVELIELFQNAAKKLKISSRIVSADASKLAPALYFSDKHYIIPRVDNKDYLNSLINICNKEDIKLIIPTIDTELPFLSTYKETIESKTNAIVLISNKEVIKVCRDKYTTDKFLSKYGFGKPEKIALETIKNNYENLEYPLFIKPKSGSSSIGAHKVNSQKELTYYLDYLDEPILQEFADGDEYTVDTFLDFNSNVITIVPRLRLATRSGEISKGKIIKDREIINAVRELLNVLKPIGPITVQLIKTDQGIKFIEVNPRFGGGAPMSILSGANSCENLYRLLMGETLEYNEDYNDETFFLRYDQTLMLSKGQINYD